MGKLTEEYGSTEAGKALEAKGFKAKSVGGVVVFRKAQGDVEMDVLDASTGMAPRTTADAVTVHVGAAGGTSDAWTLTFTRLSDFIATLK